MTDAERTARNRERLQECHPVFRVALAMVIATLDAQGYRPRIQEAWRSPADELADFKAGRSHVAWGFHNATNPDGTPAALAADVLDDDHPLSPSRSYLLALVRAARAQNLDTGITWDLPVNIRAALEVAIRDGAAWDGKIGWDSDHVQVAGMTIQQARAGVRPTTGVLDGVTGG